MRRFWTRRSNEFDLEHELRSARPEPRSEFVRSFEQRMRTVDRPRIAFRVARPRVGFRLVLAAGLSAALLVAVASVGGVAASAHALGAVLNLTAAPNSPSPASVANTSSPADKKSSADDQYKEQRKQCLEAIKQGEKSEDAQEKKNKPADDKAEDAQEKSNQKSAKDQCKKLFPKGDKDVDSADIDPGDPEDG